MHHPKHFRMNTLSIAALCGAAAWSTSIGNAFVVDGVRDSLSEAGYVERSVQLNVTNWGDSGLANLHSAVSDANLLISIGGRASSGNAILLFIDSKPGGVPVDENGAFIPNNLITSGGEEYTINNLGLSPTDGMRFEAGFRPDYAVRIYGDGNQAFVNRYDLAAGTRHYVGESVANIRSGGFVSRIRTSWQNLPPNASEATHGVEMSLNLPLMGVPTGTSSIKIMAIMVNGASDLGSNQVLGPLDPPDFPPLADIGSSIRSFNFETEPDIQTLTFDVTYTITDSDNDGLPDIHETNDGNFISATATGTDPLSADSDGDSYPDNLEILGTSGLGFASNPNIPNYPLMWAPGNFTSPQWTPGTSATEMTRLGNSLADQYQWRRDYRISNPSLLGTVQFKLTASGSTFVTQWGLGDSPGTIKRDGNNISGSTPATGFYQIDFNQAALTYDFGRKVFPTVEAFLSAYGLAAGEDSDFDGIPNEGEFTNNSDPSNPDSDNDGISDALDPDPLLAFRDIVFRVNMNFQTGIGAFNAASDQVKVRFFTGLAAPGELVLEDPDEDGIYSGTLANIEGAAGGPFGSYRFIIEKTSPSPEVVEDLDTSRTLNLGPAHVTQEPDIAFFSNFEGGGSELYDFWAEQFETHPGSPGQDADDDTFTNYEEFLFGTHPLQRNASLKEMTPDGNTLVIRWNELDSGVNYTLQQSDDLAPGSWDFASILSFDLAADQDGLPEGYVRYEAVVANGPGRMFFRVSAEEE